MSDEVKKPSQEAYEVRLNDTFRLRVLECKRTKSSKGDPMLEMTYELYDNSPIEHEGKKIDINGLQIKKWSVMTEKALKFFNKERKALSLPELSDPDSYGSVDARDYINQIGWALVSSELVEKKNEVTGKPILNPYTQKPLVDLRRNIDQWITPE